MAKGIDEAALTMAALEVMNSQDFIIEKVFNQSTLAELHGVRTGVTMKEQIVFAGQMGKVGLKGDATCTRKTSGAQSILTQKYWDPQGIEDTLIHCQAEMDRLYKAYYAKIKSYKENYEMTSSDLATFLTMLIDNAVTRLIQRAVWFGDKNVAAAQAALAGLKVGANSVYYDYFDGLWHQIFAAVSALTVKHVSITENAQVTLPLQLTFAADRTKAIMDAMWAVADPRLKSDPSAAFYCTGVLFENYVTSLEKLSEHFTIETTQSGLSSVTKKGKKVINMETIWDLDLQADFVDNTINNAGYLPNRIILTTPENIPVGTLNQADFTDLEIWYEKLTRNNYTGFGFSLDAKLLEEYMIVAAF
jgi:hypothetical protein